MCTTKPKSDANQAQNMVLTSPKQTQKQYQQDDQNQSQKTIIKKTATFEKKSATLRENPLLFEKIRYF